MITVRHCKEVDEDNKRSCRQQAHTYHYKNTICVAVPWLFMPLENQLGILAHEVGHLLVDSINHKESEADRLANKFFKIKILYKDYTIHCTRVQYLSNKDINKVYKWMLNNIEFRGKAFSIEVGYSAFGRKLHN